METLFYSTGPSPVGPLGIAVSDRGLVALEFIKPKRAFPAAATSKRDFVESRDRTAHVWAELDEYFHRNRREFTVPLDLRGTDFQLACWRELLNIPFGATRTYADIARAIRKPNAFRAVGMANHDNPVAIIVPCHRVIASTGGLCGYGGGLDLKQKLLELEGAVTTQLAIG